MFLPQIMNALPQKVEKGETSSMRCWKNSPATTKGTGGSPEEVVGRQWE